jgi:cell division septal protein FtsQ
MADESQNDEKPVQQSIFSARSGIQDPLTKSEGSRSEAANPETRRADNSLTEEADTNESEPDRIPATEEEIEPATPERKRRRGKGKPRLAKSKRQLERARRRQMNYLQRRREQKKLKVFYGRIRTVFKLCFAILWGVLLWELVHSSLWIYTPARFEVKNQRLLQTAQLAPLVQSWQGRPLYAIDTGKLADTIENRFDIVERASVRRRLFPSRLDVQIQEKLPWAELYTDEKQSRPYALIVPDGMIALANYQYKPGIYRGVMREKLLVRPKTQFRMSYLEQLRNIAWQARQIKGYHLVNVDVRNPNNVILNYAEVPVILGRLNQSASDRLARLVPLLPKILEFRDGIESVDLRWEEQVTFHQKPNSKIALPKTEKVDG